jgi:probable HAF family extracellular repeat protein
VWEVQLATNAQADSTVTIRNQCQQPHSFNVTAQQAPFLQMLTAGTITVPGHSNYECPVRFNTNGINPGEYRSNVIVKCQDCQKEKTCTQDVEVLQLHLTVQAAQPSPTATPSATNQSTPRPTPSPTPSTEVVEATPFSSPSPSPCAPAPTPTTYSVKDLKALPTIEGTPLCFAAAVNDAGNVVGNCLGKFKGGAPSAGWRAFRTDAGGAAITADDDLGFTEGISFATAVNSKGHVVGYWSGPGSDGDKAFWHSGEKKTKMTSLQPDKKKFAISRAFAINSSDDVVGSAYDPKLGLDTFGITFAPAHAVIWPGAVPASMTDLNDGLDAGHKKDWLLTAAFGISDDGDIVGRAYYLKTKKYHAFLLKGVGGTFLDLGTLKEDVFDSSAAYALSTCDSAVPETDRVVGYTYTDSKTYPGKAFHYGFEWTEAGGLMEFETLPPYYTTPLIPLESYAQAINKKGEVVGAVSFAFHLSQSFEYEVLGPGPGLYAGSCTPNSHAIWYNGVELKDLNKLIPSSPGWEVNLANGINEKGWIAGSGFFKCSTDPALSATKLSKAVLLVPAGSLPTSPPAGLTATCPIAPGSGNYLFNNFNVCGVKNGPTKETTFAIDSPHLITFIATYHWNGGRGALPAGKGISLKDSAGKLYGPFVPVTTSAGEGGAANVGWECHPGITLPAGTYTIIDPDPATWSQNDGSGGSGFARVVGSIKK